MGDFKMREALFDVYREEVKKLAHHTLSAGRMTLCEYVKLLPMMESPDEESVRLADSFCAAKLKAEE